MRTLTLLLALVLALPAAADPTVGGPTSPDGKLTVAVDLPVSQRTKNVGGTDGAGLCVFSSIGHSARWQNETRLVDFQAKMRQERGGGWPEKVDQMIKKYGSGTSYLQYEGTDPTVLIEAIKGGRMPGVTYNGHDPHYSGSISHMVNLVAYTGDSDTDWVCVLDNNYVGDRDLVWLRPREFKHRWCGSGSGWAVVLLAPPPPPIPVNALPGEDLAPLFDSLHALATGKPRVQSGPVFGVGQAADAGTVYSWVWKAEAPNHVYLCHGWRVVGAWSYAEERFYWREPGKKAYRRAVAQAPFAVPRRPVGGAAGEVVLGTVTDYGVPLWRFPYAGPGEDSYRLNGKAVSAAEALECLRRGRPHRPLRPLRPKPAPAPKPAPKRPLPDDGAYLRLSVSGDEAMRGRVLADLGSAPELAPWKGRLVVQSYPPGHWHLAGVGLADGITVQAPPDKDGKGKVLHHQADYSGAVDLAAALRRVDPNFDPTKQPDARKAPLLADGLSVNTIPLALMALFGVVCLLPRRKPPAPPAPVAISTPNTQRGVLQWILPQLP